MPKKEEKELKRSKFDYLEESVSHEKYGNFIKPWLMARKHVAQFNDHRRKGRKAKVLKLTQAENHFNLANTYRKKALRFYEQSLKIMEKAKKFGPEIAKECGELTKERVEEIFDEVDIQIKNILWDYPYEEDYIQFIFDEYEEIKKRLANKGRIGMLEWAMEKINTISTELKGVSLNEQMLNIDFLSACELACAIGWWVWTVMDCYNKGDCSAVEARLQAMECQKYDCMLYLYGDVPEECREQYERMCGVHWA